MNTDYNELARQLYSLQFGRLKGCVLFTDLTAGHGEEGVLLQLYFDGREETAGDLARKLGLTSGRIANILRQLEKKKYIVRTIGTDDRRKVLVSLTESGRRHIDRVYSSSLARSAGMLDLLGEEDAHDLLRLFGRIADLSK